MIALKVLLVVAVVVAVVAFGEVTALLAAAVSAARCGLLMMCLGVGALIGLRLDRLDNETQRPDRPGAAPPPRLPRQRAGVEEGAW